MKKIKPTWISAVWATIFVVALLFGANWIGSKTSADSMTFKGTLRNEKGNLPDGSYDFRLRGYNAVNSNDQLFQVDLKDIEVENGNFTVVIEVQDELRNIPSIVEICADTRPGNADDKKTICTDNKNENPYDIALCPYYIPPRATGMFGWLVTKKTFTDRSTLNCPELKDGSTVMGDSFVDRANKLGVSVSLFGNSADVFTKQFITNNNVTQSDLPQTLKLEGNVLYISGGNSVELPESESTEYEDNDTTYSAGSGLALNGTNFSRIAGNANGQIEVWDGSSWAPISAGSNGQVLTIVGGVPVWQSGGAETDGVIGNEITNVNAPSGLVRTGTGTGGDPYVVALTTTGVGAGTYNNVTVNTYGRVTSASNVAYLTSETDGIIGNEITNLTASDGKGVLTRTGTGTGGDPYTLSVATCGLNQIFKSNGTSWVCAADIDTDTTYSAGNGLSLASTTFSVNSPTCSGSDKLQWNGSAFVCSADVDTDTDTTNFNVAAQGTGGSQNVSSGGTVTFNNGTGTTATRSGSTVTYSLNDTAVTPNTYGTNASVAQFTVDQQGRITGASSVGIDFAGNAVTSITAGNGLTNGGGPGAITVHVGAGNGITVNANDITIDTLDAADALSSTTSNGSGLEVLASGLGLLQGCSDNQILKWNEAGDLWGCAADADTDTDTTNFNVRANAGASANISSGGTVSFVDGTGTSASRSGNDIAFNLTTTGVSANTYGSSTQVPVFTVDSYGRISSVTNTSINFPAEVDGVIGNEVTNATSNSGLTRSGSGTSGDPYTLGVLLPSATDGLSSTTSSGSGLELTSSGVSLIQGCADNEILKWNEASDAWGCGADNGGSMTIGTIDSQTKSADGAVISSGVLYMQTADGSNPGLVSTGTQTFAGDKTFGGALIATCSNTSTNVLCDGGNTRGAGVVVGTNDGFGLTFETANVAAMTISSAGLITIGATTIDQAIIIDNGTGALSLGNSADAKTINVGTGTGIDTINIGTGGTAADVITFGNAGVATTLTFNSGVSTTTAAALNLNGVTSGNGLVLSATALTSGNAFQIVGPSSQSLIRVANDSTDPLDDERVIIGQGGIAASKPDALARDQLYVFGRINYSWNMFNQDFLNFETARTADNVFGDAYFDEDAGASGSIASVSSAGLSGIARLDNPTSAAAGENEWWGTNGVGVTQRSLNPVLESRLTATANNDQRSMVGFADIATNANFDADTNVSNNEAFFRKIAAGTNWETVTRNGGGNEQICTSTVTTNAYHTLRIEVNDSTPSVSFYADGVLVKTHTNTADAGCNGGGQANTIPATGTRLGWYVGNSLTAANNRATHIDYMRVWSDDPPTDVINQALSTSIIDNSNQEQVNQIEQSTFDLVANQEELANLIDGLREDINWLKGEGLAQAAQNGGIVSSDITFKDLVSFESGVSFLGEVKIDGKVSFIGDAEFDGHVIFGSDGAGVLSIDSGQTLARFTFAKPYNKPPVVTVTPLDYSDGFKLSAVDETSFSITLPNAQTTQTRFNWIVVGKQ